MRKLTQNQDKSNLNRVLLLYIPASEWKGRYVGKWLVLASPTFYVIIIDSS